MSTKFEERNPVGDRTQSCLRPARRFPGGTALRTAIDLLLIVGVLFAPDLTDRTFRCIAASEEAATPSKSEWEDNNGKRRQIPLVDFASKVVIPATPSQYVSVDQVLYDLKTGKDVGKFNVSRQEADKCYRALSADGKYLAVGPILPGGRAQSNVMVSVFARGESEPVARIPVTDTSVTTILGDVKFLNSQRLLARVRLTGRAAAIIWDVETDKLVTRFEIQEPGVNRFAVTSDGKFIAVASALELLIHNVATGRKVAKMEAPDMGGRLPFAVTALAFSPDNTELAGFLTGERLVVWSAKGKIIHQHAFPKQMKLNAFNEVGLIWLPKGNGWLVDSHHLVDRATKSFIWEFRTSWLPADLLPTLVLDQDHVLAVSGTINGGIRYVRLSIPWEKIRPALSTAGKDGGLRPEQPIAGLPIITELKE